MVWFATVLSPAARVRVSTVIVKTLTFCLQFFFFYVIFKSSMVENVFQVNYLQNSTTSNWGTD